MKALGITAMIFAIVAIFVPLVGPFLTLIGALLAAFGAGKGITYSAVAILVNMLNVAFLSPSLWLQVGMAEQDQAGSGAELAAGMGIIFIGAQLVAALVLCMVHSVVRMRAKKAEAESS